MATDKQLDERISRWLEAEAPSQLPDRVLRATFDRTRRGRQQVGVRALLGRLQMNRSFLPLAATAAVGVAVVVALGSLGTQSSIGGPASPAPSPTATALPSAAEPTIARSATPQGFLPEGSHNLFRDPRITVMIPGPDWYGEEGGGLLLKNDKSGGPDGAGFIGPFLGDIYVPANPCQWSTTMPTTPATTVDQVVAALQGQASRDASDPVDIRVDGHAGKSIVLRVPDDANFGECARTAVEPPRFCTLTVDDPKVCHRYNQDPGQIDELLILDVDGVVMIFNAGYYEGTPAQHVAELRAIVDSINLW